MKWWKEQDPGVRSSPSSIERPWDPEPSDPTSPWLSVLTGLFSAHGAELCVCVRRAVGVACDDPCKRLVMVMGLACSHRRGRGGGSLCVITHI